MKLHKVAVTAAAFAALAGCSVMPASMGGWTTLVDGDKGLENFDRIGNSNWRAEDGAIVADRNPDKTPSYLVTRTPYSELRDPRRVLGEPRREQRHLLALQGPEGRRRRDLLRGQHLRPAARPDLRHRRDRQGRQGRPDAQGRRQVEHLRGHDGRLAPDGRAQRRRRPSTSRTPSWRAARSRCSTAPAPSSGARWRSGRW